MNKSISFLFALALLSCDHHPSNGSRNPDAPAQAKPFKGEAYQSLDGQHALTVVSADELELREGNENLLCKYTRQDGVFRVIANVMGSTEVIYFTKTDQGLRSNDGRVYLTPAQRENALEAIRQAETRKAEEAERIANERKRARQQTKEIATFSLIPDEQRMPDRAILTDVSIILHFPQIEGQQKDATETFEFADFLFLRPVQKKQGYRYKGDRFQFYVGRYLKPNVGLFGYQGYADLATQNEEEANRVRNAVVQAYTVWKNAFPHAALKADFTRGY